jgi:hypothetical protein
MTKDTYVFIGANTTPEQYMDLFARYYGPTMNAVDAARGNGKEPELMNELVALAKSFNQNDGRSISIPATFMRVTVAR